MFLQVFPLAACPREGVSMGVGSAWSVEGGLLILVGVESRAGQTMIRKARMWLLCVSGEIFR